MFKNTCIAFIITALFVIPARADESTKSAFAAFLARHRANRVVQPTVRPILQPTVRPRIPLPSQNPMVPYSAFIRRLLANVRSYSFDQILDSKEISTLPQIICDADGAIISISDGLQSSLYISSFPRTTDNFNQLRTHATVAPDAAIGLYTLNTDEEQKFFTLPQTLESDAHVIHHQYPTVDFTAPSIRDLVCGVYDLSTRDERQETIACVHCKAGVGRSVTMAASYLIYLYTIAEKQLADGSPAPTIDDPKTIVKLIMNYIKHKRPIAAPNLQQYNAMEQFYIALSDAGSLEILHKKHI